METISEALNKEDFVKFFTDERLKIKYDGKIFTKKVKGKLVKIKQEDQLIYEIHLEKKLLIVVNAMYCTYNKDEYWDIAKLAGLEEVLADPNTLVRI